MRFFPSELVLVSVCRDPVCPAVDPLFIDCDSEGSPLAKSEEGLPGEVSAIEEAGDFNRESVRCVSAEPG
jgi:hypothetical protein